MSPRRNRPKSGDKQLGRSDDDGERHGLEVTQSWRGEEWVVRRIAGSAAVKHYRCPGCDQEIAPGVSHVVAWQQHSGADDRRHWHSSCWNARDRRSTRLQRSRNAPRY